MKAITISLIAHLALLTVLTLASIFAAGLLPIPRSVILAFHDNARMVRLEDIELPRPKGPATTTARRSFSPPTITSVPNLVPIDAPSGIAAETGPAVGTPSAYGKLGPIAIFQFRVSRSHGDHEGLLQNRTSCLA